MVNNIMDMLFKEIKNLYTGKLVYTKRPVSFTRLGIPRILEKYSLIKIQYIKIEKYFLYSSVTIQFRYKDYPSIIELDLDDLDKTIGIIGN